MVNAKPHSKDKLLEAAHGLFLSQGFSATSVDQICRKAKLTKGGFFHYFKSKDDLGKAVLERFCASSHQAMMQSGCCTKNPDPLDRVFANLDCVADQAKQGEKYKGCLIATFAQEMSDSHPQIQAICAQGLKGWAKMIKDDLQLAKKKYSPRSAIDVQSLAEYCVGVIEGAQVMAKATDNPSAIRKSIEHLKQYLEMLFKKPTTKENS
jgi:TetR/AcrR family transcriptional regulator, transcriptional repressor for nem operon